MRASLLRRWAVVACLPLFVAVAAPRTASAAEPSPQDIAQARELGQRAQAAYQAGNYAESAKLWAAASQLYPVAPTLTLGLARADAKLGKVVEAQEAYNKIIREWGNVASPKPAYKDALDAARAEVSAVSPRIAGVVIKIDGPKDPTVTIDGATIPRAALGLERPVNPGEHVVKATAEGYEPAQTTFSVAEGGHAEAKLHLTKSAAPVAEATPVTSPPPPQTLPEKPAPGGKRDRTLAYAALGVGGAGLVFGAVTGVLALGKHGDLADRCPGGVCPPDAQGDVDSYTTMGTLSTVGFVVGGVGLAAGAVLWLTAPKSRASATGPRGRFVSIAPYVGPAAAGVTGRF